MGPTHLMNSENVHEGIREAPTARAKALRQEGVKDIIWGTSYLDEETDI